jgi:carboxyl-terminal processing protease
MEDGLLKAVAPIDETPAAKAGIMANDIITHLDDVPVQRLALDQAVEKMRGPENSKIKLKIVRKGQDKPIEVSITRARIQVRSVRSRLEGDDVGFIRVTQFNEQTTDDLKKAITELSAQAGDKLKGFIIDLRNNPGGLLDQAVSVSMRSWRGARSCRRAAAPPRKPCGSMRARATSPRTSQSSC